MSINFNEHVLGVGPNGELPPHVFDQLEIPDANERAAMQAILDDYQTGQDATDTAVASVIASGEQAQAALDARFAKVDVAPSGNQATDIANVKAAGTAAAAAGRNVLRLAPGHYDFAGVTPDDIGGCIITGDGVTVTPTSYVYPFSTTDLANRTRDAANNGGRGRVAFEVDDALELHWTRLFPLCKRLGITMATAWHTDNGAKWIKEAYRHGWEIMAHLPDNITATQYLADGQLDAAAQSSLAKIEAVTGNRDGVGFVYPQHVRSDETDRVLSKYFTRGRGMQSPQVYPRGLPAPWLVSAHTIDLELAGGNVSQTLRNEIQMLAATDGQMVMYLHYDSTNADNHDAALAKLVALLRSEGVEIVNPRQIWGRRTLVADPYLEDTTQWTITGPAAWDTTAKYHGTRSLKITPGASAANVILRHNVRDVASRPGHFTVMRASVRRRNTETVNATANGQGLMFWVYQWHRKRDAGSPSSSAAVVAAPAFPKTGAALAPAEWERYQELVYLSPSLARVGFAAGVQNIVAGQPPLWLDEVKFDHVDYVTSVQYTVTLAGTSNVFLYTGVPELSRHAVAVAPVSAPAGFVSAVPLSSSSNGLLIKSTNAADTMDVKVTITPGGSYDTAALSSSGA